MRISARAMAERFIHDQFTIMKKYGAEPHIDQQRYETVLAATERTLANLTGKVNESAKRPRPHV